MTLALFFHYEVTQQNYQQLHDFVAFDHFQVGVYEGRFFTLYKLNSQQLRLEYASGDIAESFAVSTADFLSALSTYEKTPAPRS